MRCACTVVTSFVSPRWVAEPLALGPGFWKDGVCRAGAAGAEPVRRHVRLAGRQRRAAAGGLHVAHHRRARAGGGGHAATCGTPPRTAARASRCPTAAGCTRPTARCRPDGGVGAVRFDAGGEVVGAYRILAGTQHQLRGRPDALGHVAVVRGARRRPRLGVRPDAGLDRAWCAPALGTFAHEAVAVDPVGRRAVPHRGQRPTGASTASPPSAWPDADGGHAAGGEGRPVTRWPARPR